MRVLAAYWQKLHCQSQDLAPGTRAATSSSSRRGPDTRMLNTTPCHCSGAVYFYNVCLYLDIYLKYFYHIKTVPSSVNGRH